MKSINLLGLFLCVLALFFQTPASDYRGDERIEIEKGDTLRSDLFAGGQVINIYGFVDGDVFAGGERVTVKGGVEDDLLAGGSEVEIYGSVGDGVLALCGSLLIDGEVNGDVLGCGGEIIITKRAKINGDVYVGSGKLTMEGGQITGSIKGGAGKTYLNGIIANEVVLETGDIEFGPNYRADGGTRLTLSSELNEEKAGHVPANIEIEIERDRRFFQRGFFYWSLISMLVAGLILVLFFKDFFQGYLTFAGQNIPKNLGFGLMYFILPVIAIVVLCVLILTIPVGLILLAIYLVLLYLSYIFTALFVGYYLLKSVQKEGSLQHLLLQLILGVVMVLMITKIPFLGGLFSLLVICFGMGSFINYLWNLKTLNGAQAA